MAMSLLEVNWVDLGASQGHIESLPLNHNICTSETKQERDSLAHFTKLLSNPQCTTADIEKAVQQYGIPNEKRSQLWLTILFPEPDSYIQNRHTKREDYVNLVLKYYTGGEESKADLDLQDLIKRDTDRTHPKEFFGLFGNTFIQDSLKRLCFLWSKENPNIGYFQGLPDLLSPFFCVFLSSKFGPLCDRDDEYNNNVNINTPTECIKFLPAIEADTYWCLTKLMFGLQAHIPFTQALHAEHMVGQLRDIMKRIRPELVHHIEVEHGLDFVIFAFRWHHCFMSRELSFKNALVLWDFYLVEGIEGFSRLQLFVAAQFLLELEPIIMTTHDTAGIMGIFQQPPFLAWDPVKVQKAVREAQALRRQFDSNQ